MSDTNPVAMSAPPSPGARPFDWLAAVKRRYTAASARAAKTWPQEVSIDTAILSALKDIPQLVSYIEKLAASSGLSAPAEDLLWVIDNIYTIARRESRREVLRPEMWGHVLRLCEKAGAHERTVGVLRAARPAQEDPST
jgi:hypothetical protein